MSLKKWILYPLGFLIGFKILVSVFMPAHIFSDGPTRPIEKVLICLLTDAKTKIGGAETIYLQLKKELKKRSIECKITKIFSLEFFYYILFKKWDAVHVGLCHPFVYSFLDFLHIPYSSAEHTSPTAFELQWIWQANLKSQMNASTILFVNPKMATFWKELGLRGVHWPLGCDTDMFQNTTGKTAEEESVQKDLSFLETLPRPHLLFVGRMVPEKNIPIFLDLETPGTKIVIGDGLLYKELKEKYKDAVFLGRRARSLLKYYYTNADVLVNPSLMESVGLTTLEAVACGTPVAGLIGASGLTDTVTDRCGVLAPDLKTAVTMVLAKKKKGDFDPISVRKEAMKYSWERCADVFLENQVLVQNVSLWKILRKIFSVLHKLFIMLFYY